jgi:cell division cycle protein 20 (cofactor of APC complex)
MKLQRDENWAPRNDYHEILSKNVLSTESLTDCKVLSYKHKPPQQQTGHNELRVLYSLNKDSVSKQRLRPNRVVPQNAVKLLDAPGLVDDFYAHPIDWSAGNVVAVALTETVFLFDAVSGRTEQLLALPEGSVTGLRWTGEGLHLGVGTTNGDVQIWDGAAKRQLRSLKGHAGHVGALAWHEHVLSSGAADAEVHHHDVRVRDHLVGRLAGAHADLICGMDYSSGGTLASGGNDNTVCIWENTTAKVPLHTLTEHRAAVKALRWCPWQRSVLATGGGSADRQVCLWNAMSGRLLVSADAESQVTGLAWGGPHERELITSHGYPRNHMTLWKYPSLVKSAELDGQAGGGRLLDLAQSPDGSMICAASADETLRFWEVFSPKAAEKKSPTGGAAFNSIAKTIR